MKALFSFVFTCLFSILVFATEQRPDKIIYNGKEYSLNNFILEIYFDKYPEKHPIDIGLAEDILNTGLWRGYIATYEVVNNELWIKDIQVYNKCKDKMVCLSVIDQVFPKKEDRKITWYSGVLELVSEDDYILRSPYEFLKYNKYILLKINKSKVEKNKNVTIQEYIDIKKEYYHQYMKTRKFRREFREKKKWYKDNNMDMTDERLINDGIELYEIKDF